MRITFFGGIPRSRSRDRDNSKKRPVPILSRHTLYPNPSFFFFLRMLLSFLRFNVCKIFETPSCHLFFCFILCLGTLISQIWPRSDRIFAGSLFAGHTMQIENFNGRPFELDLLVTEAVRSSSRFIVRSTPTCEEEKKKKRTRCPRGDHFWAKNVGRLRLSGFFILQRETKLISLLHIYLSILLTGFVRNPASSYEIKTTEPHSRHVITGLDLKVDSRNDLTESNCPGFVIRA